MIERDGRVIPETGSAGESDLAAILASLPVDGASEYVRKVMEVHSMSMRVYAPAQAAYEASMQVRDSINGFSSSTNS